MNQPDLFTAQAESIHDLPAPTMTYADATLNYRQYQQEGRGWFPDPNTDDRVQSFHTVTECWLPESSGVKQEVEQFGMKRMVPYTIYGREEHKSAGELINWWLDQRDYKTNGLNKDSEAGKWILAHAAEMNTARRYWDAFRQHREVLNIEQAIEQLQEKLRKSRLTLSVKVREAAADRNFTVAEKELALKELGA